MSDETAEKIIDIWQRKQDFFTNCADGEKESHLTKQSRDRVSEFYKVYNKMNSTSRKIARRAIISV